MNNPKSIFVHCTATPEGRYHNAVDIDQMHKRRGWKAIGYHAVVLLDGSEEVGRDLDNDGDAEEHVGAHAYGYNKDSLAVVYVGGVDSKIRPKDTRTLDQRVTLVKIVQRWMDKYDIPIEKVFGHYEVDPGKACPSFDMAQFRREVVSTDAMESHPPSKIDSQEPTGPIFSDLSDEEKHKLQGLDIRKIKFPVLSIGKNGFYTLILQYLLRQNPLVDLKVDGDFGEITREAVTKFQEANSLSQDGVAGPKTWQVLISRRFLR